MGSDIGSDTLMWSRKSFDRVPDYMGFRPAPATMDSGTFTLSHEDDDGAVSTESTDCDSFLVSISTITSFKPYIFIFSCDSMYLRSVDLLQGSFYLRKNLSFSKIPVIFF